MDFPYICDHQEGYSAGGYSLSMRWFLTWYIYLFFKDWQHWWSADIAQNLWSLVCSCLKSYWAYHLFPLLIFKKLLAICTEFNLLNHICFVLFMIMDFPYICDHQEGYSAGGYSLSMRWFLTWYIYLFIQDWQHWWVLILHKTYDHWSLAVLTVTEHFIYSHFWFFFKLVAFCTEFNLFTPISFVLFMIMDSSVFVISKWATLLVDIHCPRGGS